MLEKDNVSIIFAAVNVSLSNCRNETLNQMLINKIRCKMNERRKKLASTTWMHWKVQWNGNTDQVDR